MFRDNFPGSSEVIWKRVSILIVLPLLLAALAAGQNQNRGGGSDAPDPPKTLPGLNDPSVNNAGVDVSSYLIGPNDILNITVFREKDWSGLYPVRTDGMITVALVGELKAAGLTPKQLEKQFTEALKEQLTEPNVTVAVYEVRSKTYHVTGGVRRAGTFPLIKNPTTVFDAINDAGGFSDNFANQTDIQIIRGTQRLKFNYKDFVKGKNLDKNIPLQDGDTVLVK
jgi:polysaccharide export outer membrane protein